MNLKLLIVFFLLFVRENALAKDYLRVGFFGSDASKPNELSLGSNKPIVENGFGGGFIGGGQAELFWGLYAYGDFQFEYRGTKAEYEYTPNPGTTFTASDLKSSNILFGGHLGLRFRFLSIFYVGGGYYLGRSQFNYNEEHYKTLNNGSDQGFETTESQSIWGPYQEAGIMFVGEQWGLGFTYRQSRLRTGVYETLGNHRMNFKRQEFIVDYIKSYDSMLFK